MMRVITAVLALGLWVCFASTSQAQPATGFNVKNFGAAGDGQRVDTDAINKAIQAASDAGGGTVLVPAGTYVSGTIRLQNNVILWIDAGATILGTKTSPTITGQRVGVSGTARSSWPTASTTLPSWAGEPSTART